MTTVSALITRFRRTASALLALTLALPLAAQCTSKFSSPSQLVRASDGTIYLADRGNHTIRKITAAGTTSVLAGLAGTSGSTDGTGSAARFSSPTGLFLEASGNLLVADTGNNRIRRVTPAGVVTTVAGSTQGSTDGPALTFAKFKGPQGVVEDASGNIYIADTGNHTIRKFDGVSAQVSTIAGAAGQAGAVDSNDATVSRFNQPTGLWLSSNGNSLFIVDRMNHAIRNLIPGVGGVSTFYGSLGVSGSADGFAQARFNQPVAIIGNATYLWVAEAGNHIIRQINQSSGYVSTFAGAALQSGSVDGAGTVARFNQPQGLCWDGAGTLTIADTGNHTLRRQAVQASPNYPVTTWMGVAGSPGSTDCTQTAPTITTQPLGGTIAVNASFTFSVVASGSTPMTYQWRKGGVAINGATASSYAIASAQLSNAGSYDVVVSNIAGSVTSSAATLVVQTPPSITAQPQSLTVNGGASATFSVTATGVPAPTYQWRFGGTAITGATSSSYTITNAQQANAGSYDVVATNAVGSATSTAATLTVNGPYPPNITTQPASQSVPQGMTATFGVTVTGTAPFTYQWRKNGTAISGATGSTYQTPLLAASDNGSTYSVVVTNSVNSATSSAATLTVTAAVAPTISTQPASQSVQEGQTATFSVVATGSAPLSYQWRKNGSAISGATGASYTTPASVMADSGSAFSVVVSNSVGSPASANATLTVTPAPPSIVTQPQPLTVTAGQSATFSVSAAGTAPLSYQWRKNGTAISGATSASYSITTTATGDAGSYDVVVTNTAGGVTSSAASLTVNPGASVSVTVSPTAASMAVGGTQSLSATVSGTTNTAVTWTASGGSFSGSGLNVTWTAPQVAGTYTVTATSQADPSKSAAATIRVNPLTCAP